MKKKKTVVLVVVGEAEVSETLKVLCCWLEKQTHCPHHGFIHHEGEGERGSVYVGLAFHR